MDKKQKAVAALLEALEEDRQAIDDKNVDTAELEALIEQQTAEYLTIRNAARQRITVQRNAVS